MRPAPLLGALAGLSVLVLVVVPYALDAAAVSVYYGVGLLGPPALAAFAGVGLIALLSGAAGRSDPVTTAGVAVSFAAFVAVLGAVWVLAAAGPVGGIENGQRLEYHRWAFLVAALGFLVAAGWQARLVLRE
jgi:hypothetical protein